MDKKVEIVPQVIDLNIKKSGQIDESWLRMFGGAIESILGRMFGGGSVPVLIRGTPQQVDSFAQTLNREKRYLESYKNLGLDNPATYQSKLRLDSAVRNFEAQTGLKWPFN